MENLKEKTLIQILDDAGVKILRNNPKSRSLSHLEYNGKIIIAPRAVFFGLKNNGKKYRHFKLID